jgi:FkbM family methyltransferase
LEFGNGKNLTPESDFFLIEGNTGRRPYLKNTKFPYKIAMRSDSKKSAVYYKHNGNDNTGNSLYIEQSQAYSEQNSTMINVTCDTLSSILEENKIEHIDFIKIDVQGSEKDVINGGLDMVKTAKVVLLELQLVEYNKGAPMISEMIEYMDQIRFQLFDIIKLHYTPNHVLLQVDALFGRKDITDIANNYT